MTLKTTDYVPSIYFAVKSICLTLLGYFLLSISEAGFINHVYAQCKFSTVLLKQHGCFFGISKVELITDSSAIAPVSCLQRDFHAK